MENPYALVTTEPSTNIPDMTPLFFLGLAAICAAIGTAVGSEEVEEQEEVKQQEPVKVTLLPSPGLEEILLAALDGQRKGFRAKDLVPIVRATIPDITKSDINSCLYKLLKKRAVAKSADKKPVWIRRTL